VKIPYADGRRCCGTIVATAAGIIVQQVEQAAMVVSLLGIVAVMLAATRLLRSGGL